MVDLKNYTKMHKILVYGSSGFLGKKLVKYFLSKNYYVSKDSKNFKFKLKKKNIKIKEIVINNKLRKDQSRFGEGFSTNLSIIFTFFKCVMLIK